MSKAVMEFLDFNSALSNMKDVDYKNTLAIAALIELLMDKGIIAREDFSNKAQELERAGLAEIILKYRSNR